MKSLYSFIFSILLTVTLSAQNGLERIIVEKYYVSDDNDKTVDGDGGELPLNSVTYRVFVDMLPGYIFQAAYGVPEHELRIATTTRFFNNQDRGARFPTYSRSQAQNNTVMLDSWLSAGASLKDYTGVLKEQDNGENNIVNADDVLLNDHEEAGIPLTVQDGAILAPAEPVTVVGFFDTDLIVLDDANDAAMPTIISTHDGAWSSLNGSRGVDTLENIVLIGQFTTDGVFEFELNLQLRNQATLGVENYVARNATGNEILFDQLIHIDSLGFNSAITDVNTWGEMVSIYPNPTKGSITVKVDDTVLTHGQNYTILSLTGSDVLDGILTSGANTIHMNDMMPGVYLFTMRMNDGSRFAKRIVRIQ